MAKLAKKLIAKYLYGVFALAYSATAATAMCYAMENCSGEILGITYLVSILTCMPAMIGVMKIIEYCEE